LNIEEMQTASMLTALEDDRIDVGLAATPLRHPGLEERPLFYEPFFLLVRKDHELAKKRTIDPDDLDASELWLLKQGHCFRDQMARICSLQSKHSVFPNVHFESGNLETIKELVAKNGGYTLLPLLATRGRLPSGTVLRPFIKPRPSREVGLVTTRTQLKRPLVDIVWNCIRVNLPRGVATERNPDLDVLKV
jgi:LysR family hydrogen peroxide-inducible transcriptional activator